MLGRFEQEIEHIRYFLQNSSRLTNDDLRLLKRVLKIIENNMRYAIFTEIINNNEDINRIIKEIDSLIGEYNRQIYLANRNESIYTVISGNKKVDIAKSYIKDLERMKENIQKKDFASLVKDFVLAEQDEQSLIDMCAVSLADGYNSYEEYFGAPMVMQEDGHTVLQNDVISAVFSLINDNSLNQEITDYVNMKRKKNVLLDEREKNANIQKIYKFVVDNFSVVKDYINAMIEKKKYDISVEAVEEEIATINDSIKRYNSDRNIVSRLVGFTTMQDMMQKRKDLIREKNTVEQPSINFAIDEFDFAVGSSKISSDSLKRFIEKGIVVISDGDVQFNPGICASMPVEKKIVDVCMKDNLSELMALLKEAEKRTFSANDEYAALNNKLIELENGKLSLSARELIKEYYPECEKIVNLQNAPQKEGKTPFICAFILEVLCTSKDLGWKNIHRIIKSKMDVESVAREYEDMIANYVYKYEEQLSKGNYDYDDTKASTLK